MKSESTTRDKWRCDRCGRKVDTLYYFAGKLNICGECRDKDRKMLPDGQKRRSATELAEAT